MQLWCSLTIPPHSPGLLPPVMPTVGSAHVLLGRLVGDYRGGACYVVHLPVGDSRSYKVPLQNVLCRDLMSHFGHGLDGSPFKSVQGKTPCL